MPKEGMDPGHGGTDPGSIGLGLEEEDVTLQFTQLVAAGVRRCGIDVLQSRTADVTVPLENRDDIFDNWGADHVSSYHVNSNEGTPGTGFESFVQMGFMGTETDRQRRLIHNEMAEVAIRWGIPDRGCKEADLLITRDTNCPAALFELGFINNPKDNALVRNPQFMAEMAEAAIRGTCKVHGVAYVPPIISQPPSDQVVSAWAVSAWKKAMKKGFIKGDGQNLNPKETITKEQLVVFLDRLHLFD